MMGSGLDPHAIAKAARFRAEADTAAKLAERTVDPEARRQLEHIAHVYRGLAAKLDPAGGAEAGPPSSPAADPEASAQRSSS